MANIEKTERDAKLQLDTKSLLNIVNNIGFESGNILKKMRYIGNTSDLAKLKDFAKMRS